MAPQGASLEIFSPIPTLPIPPGLWITFLHRGALVPPPSPFTGAKSPPSLGPVVVVPVLHSKLPLPQSHPQTLAPFSRYLGCTNDPGEGRV